MRVGAGTCAVGSMFREVFPALTRSFRSLEKLIGYQPVGFLFVEANYITKYCGRQRMRAIDGRVATTTNLSQKKERWKSFQGNK